LIIRHIGLFIRRLDLIHWDGICYATYGYVGLIYFAIGLENDPGEQDLPNKRQIGIQTQNMKTRHSLVLAAFALLACSASMVRADTIYDFSYTAPGIQASGTFTTSGPLTPLLNQLPSNSSSGQGSGWQVVSLSGERNGDPISLLPNPNFPHWSTDPLDQYQYDDALVNRAWGLSFDFYYGLILVDDTTGAQYELDTYNGRSPGNGQEYENAVLNTYPDGVPIALTITQQVPDGGSTVGLLSVGFFTLLVFGFRQNRLAMAK
jgi:hypothetical protein